jgi:hypothetical protein
LQRANERGTIQGVRVEGSGVDPVIQSGKEIILPPAVSAAPVKRYSRGKIALAFGVAAVSDVLSIWITFLAPAQLAVDFATALVLFWILGKRWALLPGFIAEAIPGAGVFPVWVLVVLSILVYDGFRKPNK